MPIMDPSNLFWILVAAFAAGGGLAVTRARHSTRSDLGTVSRAWLARHMAPR
jgi:hypothetical protein